jgi:AAA15 family ATPase/GTPase
MAINRVEIKDFLVFKGEFAADFCPGVNVLIGGNGTGKTTLLKAMYKQKPDRPYPPDADFKGGETLFANEGNISVSKIKFEGNLNTFVYIPEKDILEHSKGLLTFIEQKQTGFGQVYKDVLISAQDVPTQEQSEAQKSIGQKITAIIGGNICWDKDEGSFYTLKTDGTRIPFTNEASGYKKLGYLGLLVSSGQLETGSILFWDEPENSLNPELVPALVDILLELSRNGVQIFVATHSEILSSYFAVNRRSGDEVMFTALYKDGEKVKANTSDRFDLLEPNNLKDEPVKLYKKEIVKGLGGNG